MSRVMLVGLLVAVFMLTACGSDNDSEPAPSPTPEAPTATPTPEVVVAQGSVALFTDGWVQTVTGETTCGGEHRGYNDIDEGMEIRLFGDGEMLDVARLGPGQFIPREQPNPRALGSCRHEFDLSVPPGYRFYTVETGRRGEFNYTWDEITTPGMLEYEIGN